MRFGSVAAGGRYDGLVSRFRGEPVPATGFSIGVSRLAAALQHLGKLDSKPEPGPVVVTVFDKDRLAEYQNMVAKLRAANIRAELYLGNPRNLGNQLKYADKRNAPCVVIQGTDEKAKGEVTIKDLIVGAELAKLEKGREEHLQKQAEAQFAVAEEKLVDAVRAVLAAPRPQLRLSLSIGKSGTERHADDADICVRRGRPGDRRRGRPGRHACVRDQQAGAAAGVGQRPVQER